jgi:hypothetical protein
MRESDSKRKIAWKLESHEKVSCLQCKFAQLEEMEIALRT